MPKAGRGLRNPTMQHKGSAGGRGHGQAKGQCTSGGRTGWGRASPDTPMALAEGHFSRRRSHAPHPPPPTTTTTFTLRTRMNSIRTIGLSRSLLASRAFAGAGAGARVAAVRPLAVAPLMARGLSNQAPAKKPIAIQELSETAELEQLDGQRNRRPTSPHLDIYQPQLTWVMSGLHRATGCAAVGCTCFLPSCPLLVCSLHTLT